MVLFRKKKESDASGTIVQLTIIEGNNDTNDDYNVICKDKEIKNINLGKIPIMVNSNYCVLNKQPEFRKNNE